MFEDWDLEMSEEVYSLTFFKIITTYSRKDLESFDRTRRPGSSIVVPALTDRGRLANGMSCICPGEWVSAPWMAARTNMAGSWGGRELRTLHQQESSAAVGTACSNNNIISNNERKKHLPPVVPGQIKPLAAASSSSCHSYQSTVYRWCTFCSAF